MRLPEGLGFGPFSAQEIPGLGCEASGFEALGSRVDCGGAED